MEGTNPSGQLLRADVPCDVGSLQTSRHPVPTEREGLPRIHEAGVFHSQGSIRNGVSCAKLRLLFRTQDAGAVSSSDTYLRRLATARLSRLRQAAPQTNRIATMETPTLHHTTAQPVPDGEHLERNVTHFNAPSSRLLGALVLLL